jgi:DNA-directed RNA polymerase subunit M/transcription elongation factor TFIIS
VRLWQRAARSTLSLTPPPPLPLRPAARCPKCSHEKAFFMQVQIRSADEPMTIFYKARRQRRATRMRRALAPRAPR